MNLTNEQLNFLVRLKYAQGGLHYTYLGDTIVGPDNDRIALEQCYLLAKEGYIIFNGIDATITDKGLSLDYVKNATTYFL